MWHRAQSDARNLNAYRERTDVVEKPNHVRGKERERKRGLQILQRQNYRWDSKNKTKKYKCRKEHKSREKQTYTRIKDRPDKRTINAWKRYMSYRQKYSYEEKRKEKKSYKCREKTHIN